MVQYKKLMNLLKNHSEFQRAITGKKIMFGNSLILPDTSLLNLRQKRNVALMLAKVYDPAVCGSVVHDRECEKENEASLKVKVMHNVVSLCCTVLFILSLTGCNPTAGATEYEMIYPSGYSRDCYTYDETSPIEGSACCLQWEEADDYKKTYDYDMHILDEKGSVLYIYPDVGSKAMRGSVQEDGKTWVCSEHWTAPHHNGYVEGWLKESNLLLIDLKDGEILFQGKAGENELYITSNETRCYFYVPGKEESEKLFGLIKIPAVNAVIYYRDTSDWTQKHTVYTFDYTAEPDIDTSNGVSTRLKFYISESQLKAAWTSYEPVGNNSWKYLEKKAYEIPFTENTLP